MASAQQLEPRGTMRAPGGILAGLGHPDLGMSLIQGEKGPRKTLETLESSLRLRNAGIPLAANMTAVYAWIPLFGSDWAPDE